MVSVPSLSNFEPSPYGLVNNCERASSEKVPKNAEILSEPSYQFRVEWSMRISHSACGLRQTATLGVKKVRYG
jgi:hypothetical protein